MCFSKPQNPASSEATPAAAPAAPLPVPDAPDVGKSRRKETRANNDGKDAPNYRVKRNDKTPTVNPSAPIQM